MNTQRPPSSEAYLGLNLVVAVAYVATGILGQELARVHGTASLLWPPTGIAIAAVLLWGWRVLPSVAVGALLVNTWLEVSATAAALIAVGNTLEAVVAASLVRWGGFDPTLADRRDLLRLALYGFVLAPVVAASIGALALCGFDGAAWAAYPEIWSAWWLGDAVGGLFIAPLMLVWLRRGVPTVHPAARGVAELAALCLLLATAALLAGEHSLDLPRRMAQLLLLPLMVWAGLRFGMRGATGAALGVIALGAWRATATLDAAALESDLAEMLSVFAVITVTTLLAAASSEADQLRRSLAASEERYRTLVEVAPICIHEIDLDGRIITMNKSGIDMLGLPDEAAVCGVRYLSFVDDAQTDEISALLARAIGGEGGAFEFDVAAADGPRYFASCFVPIRDGEGQVVRLMGVTQDLTARRRADEERFALANQLVQAQKLEGLGRLAGGIAHDFNNILQAILGSVELMRPAIEPTADVVASLDTIELATTRASDLCRKMLTYAGEADHERDMLVDMAAVARESAAIVGAAAPPAVSVRVNCPCAALVVRGDATQLRQVTMNLLTNAVDASGDEGDVQITVSQQAHASASALWGDHINPLPAGPVVVVEVADVGRGIDAASLPRIFDPFFSTKGAGRGLGLAASLGIIRGHGGAIDIESAPGHGTRIQVSFALAEETVKAADAVPRTPVRGRGTVLLVDDEPDILRLIARLLRRDGLTVLTAADGATAVERFNEDPDAISIVVMDVTMPKMNGIEAGALMKARRPGVPILLSSGYAAAATALDAFDGYLAKPYAPAALRAALAPYLSAEGGEATSTS